MLSWKQNSLEMRSAGELCRVRLLLPVWPQTHSPHPQTFTGMRRKPVILKLLLKRDHLGDFLVCFLLYATLFD